MERKFKVNDKKLISLVKKGIKLYGSQYSLARAMGYKRISRDSAVARLKNRTPSFMKEVTIQRLANALNISFEEILEKIGAELIE